MEYDRHRNLPDRHPGSDPFSFDGVLHGPTGRAARRCGYLLDCGSARAGRALLRLGARRAASRAAAAHPAHLTPQARFRFFDCGDECASVKTGSYYCSMSDSLNRERERGSMFARSRQSVERISMTNWVNGVCETKGLDIHYLRT